jgi:hypothetical protein
MLLIEQHNLFQGTSHQRQHITLGTNQTHLQMLPQH